MFCVSFVLYGNYNEIRCLGLLLSLREMFLSTMFLLLFDRIAGK